MKRNDHLHFKDRESKIEIGLPDVSKKGIEIDVEDQVPKSECEHYAVAAKGKMQQDGEEQYGA